MSIIISCSISAEEKNFCEEFGLSPSGLLQGSIRTAMDNAKISQVEVKELHRKIAFLQETINKQRNFIEKEGLIEKFVENA